MAVHGTRLAALLIAAGLVGGTAGAAQASPQLGRGNLVQYRGPFADQAGCTSNKNQESSLPDTISTSNCFQTTTSPITHQPAPLAWYYQVVLYGN
jgi:hypothetical protein